MLRLRVGWFCSLALVLGACGSDPDPSSSTDSKDSSAPKDATTSSDGVTPMDSATTGDATSTDAVSNDSSSSMDTTIARDAAADDGNTPTMDGSGGTPDVRSDLSADVSNQDADGAPPPDPTDATSEDVSAPPSGDGAVDGDTRVADDAGNATDAALDAGSDVASDVTTTTDATDDADGSGADGTAASGFPGSALVDDVQGAMINGWVGTPTQLWTLCYTTALHQRGAVPFHTNCDFKGPSVSIAKVSYATETRIIGGYNSSSWYSPTTGQYGPNSESFLFSVTNAFKHTFPGTSSGAFWVYNHRYYGPTFGGGSDWYVHSQFAMGTCRPGFTYACRVGTMDSTTCNVDFCGTPTSSDYFTLDVLEVWVK